MAASNAIRAGRAFVEFFLDDKKLTRGLAGVQRKLERFAGRTARAGVAISALGAAMATPFTAAIKAASKAETSLKRATAIFGDDLPLVQGFAKELSKSIGRAEIDILDAASSFQSILVGQGFGADEARAMSEQFTKLAFDLASFSPDIASDEEGIRRFIGALEGEAENLDRLGINLKAAALDHQLLAMGLKTSAQGASEMQKITARLALIQQSMTRMNAVGAAQWDTTGNLMQRAASRAREAAIAIGNALLPVVSKLTATVQSILPGITAFVVRNDELILAAAAATAGMLVLGPALLGVAASAQIAATGIGLTSTALSAVALLLTPGGAIAAGLVAGGALWLAYSNNGQKAMNRLKESGTVLKTTLTDAFKGIATAMRAGDIELAGEIVAKALETTFAIAFDAIATMFGDMVAEFRRQAAEVAGMVIPIPGAGAAFRNLAEMGEGQQDRARLARQFGINQMQLEQKQLLDRAEKAERDAQRNAERQQQTPTPQRTALTPPAATPLDPEAAAVFAGLPEGAPRFGDLPIFDPNLESIFGPVTPPGADVEDITKRIRDGVDGAAETIEPTSAQSSFAALRLGGAQSISAIQEIADEAHAQLEELQQIRESNEEIEQLARRGKLVFAGTLA